MLPRPEGMRPSVALSGERTARGESGFAEPGGTLDNVPAVPGGGGSTDEAAVAGGGMAHEARGGDAPLPKGGGEGERFGHV